MNMYDALFEELKNIRNSKGTYEVGLADAIGFVKDKGGNVAYEEGQEPVTDSV